MLIVQDQVWGRVTANREEGRSTRYYMDEMHLLLKEEQTAAYSVEIWKRFNEKTTVSNRELKSMVEFYKKDMVPKYDIPEL